MRTAFGLASLSKDLCIQVTSLLDVESRKNARMACKLLHDAVQHATTEAEVNAIRAHDIGAIFPHLQSCTLHWPVDFRLQPNMKSYAAFDEGSLQLWQLPPTLTSLTVSMNHANLVVNGTVLDSMVEQLPRLRDLSVKADCVVLNPNGPSLQLMTELHCLGVAGVSLETLTEPVPFINMPRLKVLRLGIQNQTHLETLVDSLTLHPALTSLQLTDTSLNACDTDPLTEVRLPCLQELILQDLTKNEPLVPAAFPQLKRLIFRSEYDGIFANAAELRGLEHLEYLEIDNLVSEAFLDQLPALTELRVSNWNSELASVPFGYTLSRCTKLQRVSLASVDVSSSDLAKSSTIQHAELIYTCPEDTLTDYIADLAKSRSMKTIVLAHGSIANFPCATSAFRLHIPRLYVRKWKAKVTKHALLPVQERALVMSRVGQHRKV